MFRTVSGRDDESRPEVTIFIEGEAVRVPEGETVAAAVLAHGLEPVRTTPVSGRPRMPYCLMGICFDCLMEIDGVPNSQACMTRVKEGMRIARQTGARTVPEA
jgi:D-hydroxyproline dehydrogenase subunit gamma